MKARSTTLSAILAIASIIALFAFGADAQHCPYDGGSMLVVKLTDAKNKPVIDAAQHLSLRETDNPIASSCKFAAGMLVQSFLPPLDAFLLSYRGQGAEAFARYCDDCTFTGPGFYAVVLNQAKLHCMVPTADGKDYDRFVPRKFEVVYSNKGTEVASEVPQDRIYNLCLGSGKWSRIEPIELRLQH